LECTLKIEYNYPIELKIIKSERTKDNLIDIINDIKNDTTTVFYNANIYPKKEDMIFHICWHKTNKPLTITTRLQPEQLTYDWIHMGLEQLVRRFDIFKYIRATVESEKLFEQQIVLKNYEMSYDLNILEPLFKLPTTNILQEYFIPQNYIENFLDYFWSIMNKYNVNLINVSLRYVYATGIPVLNYAPSDRIAVVLYLNIGNSNGSLNYAEKWSQLLIDNALQYNGAYYLPYLPFASITQFQKAYPAYKDYQYIKSKYDPNNRFSNHFIDKYIILK
jgi:hypothetical protein